MENKNKPDNLESFFQRVLKDYEEEPDVSFWNNIAPNIPPKPVVKTNTGYKGWMVIAAFIGGLMFSALGFFLQSNTHLIHTLKEQITIKDTKIDQLQLEIVNLKQVNDLVASTKSITNQNDNKEQEITLRNNFEKQTSLTASKKSNLANSSKGDRLIKLEIARKKGVVAVTKQSVGSQLQSSFYGSTAFVGRDFGDHFETPIVSNFNQLLFDNQLITNSFFAKNDGVFENKEVADDIGNIATFTDLDFLMLAKPTLLVHNASANEVDQKKIANLLKLTKRKSNYGLGKDALTSFITFSINPISGLKYNLDGYRPNPSAIVESAGISSSWNWSVYGGFETKSKWSVQMGIDYNKLTIVKESINNIRFKTSESQKINEGYVYTFNQRSDGALGLVSVSSTIFNQKKNDGQDIENGDLFKLSVSTEQPVQVIRLPIMGGYRFDLSSRFYVMPKLGFSPVWKTKDRTQLRGVNTFDDRLSVQNSGIFLTSKITTESLEANFRTEFGFRWRPRWYLVAEPRFKYARNPLFRYKDLELKDSPFQLMLGIRFNVD